MKTKIITVAAIILASSIILSFTVLKNWTVPGDYKNKKNPVAKNAESLEVGKSQFTKVCQPCHGKLGKADGPMSKVKEVTTDFSKSGYARTEGEIYYIVTFGDGTTHIFQKIVQSDEDRWSVVNYVKSLQGK